jgi:hypothetical protein
MDVEPRLLRVGDDVDGERLVRAVVTLQTEPAHEPAQRIRVHHVVAQGTFATHVVQFWRSCGKERLDPLVCLLRSGALI